MTVKSLPCGRTAGDWLRTLCVGAWVLMGLGLLGTAALPASDAPARPTTPALSSVAPVVASASVSAPVNPVPPAPVKDPPAPPAPATPEFTPAPEVAEEYKVRVGDLLQVWIYGQPDLSQSVRVSPAGRIDFPFVGSVTVLDKTTEDISKIISQNAALNKQYNNPPVAVSVKEFAPMSAYVLGAVQKPQQILLPPDMPMTLTQAIAQAEGFREDAARQNVRVYRRDKSGKPVTLTVNVAALLDDNRPEQDVVLKSGDTIYVSPRPAGGVFVLGAVQHPGFFDLKSFNRGGDEDTITVTQALAAAGGFTEDAVEEGVRLFRRKPGANGDINLQEVVNVTEVTDGGPKTARKDPSLMPGDTVFVPPRDKIFVVGRVLRAGAYSAPQGQKLTVTKAISLAGGFDPYAERSSVKIFRHDTPGEPPEIVDVKKLFSSGDLRSDSVVNPGDLIFVPESIW